MWERNRCEILTGKLSGQRGIELSVGLSCQCRLSVARRKLWIREAGGVVRPSETGWADGDGRLYGYATSRRSVSLVGRKNIRKGHVQCLSLELPRPFDPLVPCVLSYNSRRLR